jgi:hypothetical protein
LIGKGASGRRSGLRTRGLAVGSSQLPWAHHQLAAIPGPVKGRVGLGSAAVCSRAARNSFVPPIPKPDIAVPSVGPPPGAGDDDAPAGSIGKPPMVGKNGRLNPGAIAVDAPNAAGLPRKGPPPHRILPAPTRPRPARVSAQPGKANFWAATARAVKITSSAPVAVRARSFAVPPAAKPCGACSSGSGSGDTAPGWPDGHEGHPRAAGPELVVRYFPRPHPGLRFLRPPEGGRGGRVPGSLRAPLPFSDPPLETGR